MKKYLAVAVTLLLGACASPEHAPLIFGQTHSLGVSVATNPANQTPELIVGFKDLDIAVIPTVVQAPNGPVLIQGDVQGARDAYSTFGQFDTTVSGTQVGLGKFFATGIAARRLADGFACKVSSGTEKECTARPPVP